MNKHLLSTNYKTIPAQSQVYRGSIPVIKETIHMNKVNITLCNKEYNRYKNERVATCAKKRSAKAEEREWGDI